MKWLRYLAFLFVLVLAALFALDNKTPVVLEISIVSLSFEAPLYVWMWGAFLAGVVVCYVFLALRYFGGAITNRSISKENEALRSEIDALKCEARLKEAYQEEQTDEQT